ncbi:10896_t:CDS:2, partial [Cetraspora pellucida]
MNELAQQIQSMTTNYAKLTALLATQAEANKSCSRPPTRVNVMVTCYQCSEKGHYARECLTERETLVPRERRPTQPIQVLRHEVEAYYGCIDDGYDNEREIFVADERYHSYNLRNDNHSPNSKSQWEGQLRSRSNANNQPREIKETYPLIDDKDLMQYNNDTLLTRAPRRKRVSLIIDSLAPYNVADDILTKTASATVGQMLQYPTQCRNLAKAPRRPQIVEETNYVDDGRVIEVLISNNGSKKLHQPGEKAETKDLYDDEGNLFEHLINEDKEVEETEGYFTEELTKLEVNDLKEKVKKMCVNEELDTEQQEEAKKLLKKEKNIFAQTVDELGCTNRTHHMINTGDAAPIKQNPYRAALSIKDFIKSEITQLKERELIC